MFMRRLLSRYFVAYFRKRTRDKLPNMESKGISNRNSEYHFRNCLDIINCKCSEQGAEEKKLEQGNCSGLNKTLYLPRIRPNYFVAVQVCNHVVHDAVENIQNHILSQDARLEEIMISVSTLHITLMVMHIGDEEIHKKAMKALSNVHKKLNDEMCNQPIKLDFNGLGHFGNKVLFAKIQNNKSYERLCSLNECVKTHFAEEDIFSTDIRREFRPHLTIAKIDFSQKKQRAIRKIDPRLYEKFADEYIGSQTIQGIQLLSMTDPVDDTGYYAGNKLFFSMPEVC